MVPVRAMGPFWPGDSPFRALCVCVWGGGGTLWAVSKIESSVRAPHLLRFILLGSFSDTLLVVSILDIFDFCSPEGFKGGMCGPHVILSFIYEM